MSHEHQHIHSRLPESLRDQLAKFRGHLWRIKMIESIAAGVIGLLVSFLLVYGLDRIISTPGWVRLLVLLAGASLFAGFAPYWWHKWVWRQRREDQLARLIARKFPGMGDRLLGVIELEKQDGDPESLSPRLREAAMIAVAAESKRRDLDEAIPEPRHVKWALVAMSLLIVAGSALVFTPRAGINALQRWLFPFSETERYTFTRLAFPPEELTVPFGESFEIVLSLADDTESRPAKGLGRYGNQAAVAAHRAGSEYRFRFPGQQDPGVVKFRIGDLQHFVKVTPVLRPAIEGVVAHVTPPAYLEREPESIDLNNGILGVIRGSSFSVEMSTSRILDHGVYGPSRNLGAEITEPDVVNSDEPGMKKPEQGAIGGALIVDGPKASTPVISPVGSFELPFEWTDKIGLAGDGGFQLQVEVRDDMAPACYLQGIDRQLAILPEQTVDFEILAEDDLGLTNVGIEWSGQFTRATDEKPASGELRLGGKGDDTRLVLPVAFSPSAFRVSPQKLLIRGYVEDALPGRERVYSEPVTLYVLTLDEHAQLLKNRFDRQISELEDLARRERELLEENERLSQLNGEELQKDESRRRLQQQEIEEMETSRRTEELKNEMEKLMQDAARNKDIDKKALQKMAEALKSVQELAEKDVPDVQQELNEAQDAANTQDQAESEMDEAVEKQREVLEKMQQAVQKASDANQKMEAGTFVNRLKKAAREEDGIVASIMSVADKLIGVKLAQLDPSETRRLEENGRQQSVTASDVRWIQEDLNSYYARTQKEDILKLVEKMRESKIDLDLDRSRQLIAESKAFTGAEKAKQAADLLRKWADELDAQNDSGAGGGGGAGPSPEDQDFEFMLRVMRMVQQEMDLRGRTRSLEQLRRGEPRPSTDQ